MCIPSTIKRNYMSAYQVAGSCCILESNNWIKYDFWMISILDLEEMVAWKPSENVSCVTRESGKETVIFFQMKITAV